MKRDWATDEAAVAAFRVFFKEAEMTPTLRTMLAEYDPVDAAKFMRDLLFVLLKCVTLYCSDTTELVMRKHCENADMERFCKEYGLQYDDILPEKAVYRLYEQSLAAPLATVGGTLHDVYLKSVERVVEHDLLYVPKLVGDYLFLDEAQDLTASFMHIVTETARRKATNKSQRPLRVIRLFDRHQELFSWKATTTVVPLATRNNNEITMSTTFRFGPEVAYITNLLLVLIFFVRDGVDFPHIKTPNYESILTYFGPRVLRAAEQAPDSRVVTTKTFVVDRLPTQINRIVLIARQNETLGAEILRFITSLASSTRRVVVEVPNNTGLRMKLAANVRTFRYALHLLMGRPLSIAHRPVSLRSVTNEDDLRKLQYNTMTDATTRELIRLSMLVHSTFAESQAVSVLQRCDTALETPKAGDLILALTTAHGSKGQEYEVVALACDYQLPFQDSGRVGKIAVEELYCLYVAVTRARSLLIIPDQLSKAVDEIQNCLKRGGEQRRRRREQGPIDLTAVVHDLTTDESPLRSASLRIKMVPPLSPSSSSSTGSSASEPCYREQGASSSSNSSRSSSSSSSITIGSNSISIGSSSSSSSSRLQVPAILSPSSRSASSSSSEESL